MSLFQPTTAEDNLRRTEKRLKRLERRPKGGSGGSGQQLVVGTSEFWPGTSTPPAYLIPFDGRTITNGVFTHSALAAVHPEWVSGSDIVIPDYKGRVMASYLPGHQFFGTKGARVGSSTHTLTDAQVPATPVGLSGIASTRGVADGANGGAANRYFLASAGSPYPELAVKGGGQPHPIVQPSAVGVWCVVAASTIGEYDPIVQAALVAQVVTLNTLAPRRVVPLSSAQSSGASSISPDGVVTFTNVPGIAVLGLPTAFGDGPLEIIWSMNSTTTGQPLFQLRNGTTNLTGSYDMAGHSTRLSDGPSRYSYTNLGGFPLAQAPLTGGGQFDGRMTLNIARTAGQFHAVDFHSGAIGGGDRWSMNYNGWRSGAFDGLYLTPSAGTMSGFIKIVKL